MAAIQPLRLGYLFRQSSRFRGRVRWAHPGHTTAKQTMMLPLAYSIAETCVLAHCGRTTIYEQINSGQLRAVKRGRRTIVLAHDLRAWLDALPAIDVKSPRQAKSQPPRGGSHDDCGSRRQASTDGRRPTGQESERIDFPCAWRASVQSRKAR